MKHSNNADQITSKNEVHGVRELVHERTADGLLRDGKLQRIVAEPPKDEVKLDEKPLANRRIALMVPCQRFLDVGFRARLNDNSCHC